jgi:hypothetical protein
MNEIESKIFRTYQPGLSYIGVDFSQPEIQEAISLCYSDLEAKFQAVIAYWYWKKSQGEKIENPTACLLTAFREEWKPYNWKSSYLDNPNFKTQGQLWWEECAEVWGRDLRNQLVADVKDYLWSDSCIFFTNGYKMSLSQAKNIGWDKTLKYAQQPNVNSQLEEKKKLYLEFLEKIN